MPMKKPPTPSIWRRVAPAGTIEKGPAIAASSKAGSSDGAGWLARVAEAKRALAAIHQGLGYERDLQARAEAEQHRQVRLRDQLRLQLRNAPLSADAQIGRAAVAVIAVDNVEQIAKGKKLLLDGQTRRYSVEANKLVIDLNGLNAHDRQLVIGLGNDLLGATLLERYRADQKHDDAARREREEADEARTHRCCGARKG